MWPCPQGSLAKIFDAAQSIENGGRKRGQGDKGYSVESLSLALSLNSLVPRISSRQLIGIHVS